VFCFFILIPSTFRLDISRLTLRSQPYVNALVIVSMDNVRMETVIVMVLILALHVPTRRCRW